MDKKKTRLLIRQGIEKANALLEKIEHYLPPSENNDDVRHVKEQLIEYIEELQSFWGYDEYEQNNILEVLPKVLNDFDKEIERLYNEDTDDEVKYSDENDDDDEEDEEDEEDEGKEEDLDNLREEKDDEEPPRQRQRTGTGRRKKGGKMSENDIAEQNSSDPETTWDEELIRLNDILRTKFERVMNNINDKYRAIANIISGLADMYFQPGERPAIFAKLREIKAEYTSIRNRFIDFGGDLRNVPLLTELVQETDLFDEKTDDIFEEMFRIIKIANIKRNERIERLRMTNVGTGRRKKGGAVSAKSLKELVSSSYSKNPQENIDGFVLDKSLSNETAKVYYNPHTGQATIVHRGSRGTSDWLNNAAYATGLYNTTNRYKQGEATQKAVENKYGTKNVSTIGHSQGAVLARKLGKNSKEIINLNPLYTGEEQGENEYIVNSSGDVVSSLLKPKEIYNKYLYPSTYRKNKAKNITIESEKPLDVLTEHTSKILDRLDPNQMIGQGRELGFKRYKLKPHEELSHWRGGGPCLSINQVPGGRDLPNGMRLEPGEILVQNLNDSSSSESEEEEEANTEETASVTDENSNTEETASVTDEDEDYEDLNFENVYPH